MSFYFHVNTCRVLVIRAMVIVCGFFILAACSPSRTEKSCLNTAKEKKDMISEMNSPASNAPLLNMEIPVTVGQETATFGMG